MISLTNQAACRANMLPLRECLTHIRATETSLTRAARVNFHQNASGSFSLLRDLLDETRPSGVVYGLREHSRSQTFHVQILDCNQPVLIDDLPTQLVVEVGSSVSDRDVYALKQDNSLASTMRAFLASIYAPLRDSQSAFRVPIVSRIVDLRSVAQRGEMSQSNVNPDHAGIKRQRLGLNLTRKQRKPATSFAFDRKSFDFTLDRSCEIDSHKADLRESRFVPVERVANLSEGQAAISTNGSKSGIARFLSPLNSRKETVECALDALQRVLQRCCRHLCDIWSVGLYVGQLIRLIKIPNIFAVNAPRVAPLLKCGVVKLGTQREVTSQRFLLPLGWVNSEFKNSYH